MLFSASLTASASSSIPELSSRAAPESSESWEKKTTARNQARAETNRSLINRSFPALRNCTNHHVSHPASVRKQTVCVKISNPKNISNPNCHNSRDKYCSNISDDLRWRKTSRESPQRVGCHMRSMCAHITCCAYIMYPVMQRQYVNVCFVVLCTGVAVVLQLPARLFKELDQDYFLTRWQISHQSWDASHSVCHVVCFSSLSCRLDAKMVLGRKANAQRGFDFTVYHGEWYQCQSYVYFSHNQCLFFFFFFWLLMKWINLKMCFCGSDAATVTLSLWLLTHHK